LVARADSLVEDAETAASAVRNLHGTEVGGRPLRIDLAESDPHLEGKTTNRGELPDDEPRHAGGGGGGFMSGLPPGLPVPAGSTALDVISQSLATIRPAQVMEVLGQMKVCGSFCHLTSCPDTELSRCRRLF
jgi:cleavage stimulation factor subunit 2